MTNEKGPSAVRQEPGSARRMSIFAKGQRIVSNAYCEGYENTQWEKPKTQKEYKKLGFKIVSRNVGSAINESDSSCNDCTADCSVCW